MLKILAILFFLSLKKYFKKIKKIANPKLKKSILKFPDINIGGLIFFKKKKTKNIFVMEVKVSRINPLFLSNFILLNHKKFIK